MKLTNCSVLKFTLLLGIGSGFNIIIAHVVKTFLILTCSNMPDFPGVYNDPHRQHVMYICQLLELKAKAMPFPDLNGINREEMPNIVFFDDDPACYSIEKLVRKTL